MSELADVETLSKYLDQLGMQSQLWHPQGDQEQGYIETGWLKRGVPDDGFTLFVDPYFEQEILYLSVPKVSFVPPSLATQIRMSALVYISTRNYEMPGGSFGYDPTDGEVMYRMPVAVPDNRLTFNHFDKFVRALKTSVEETSDGIALILNEIQVTVKEEPKRAHAARGKVPQTEEELQEMFLQFMKERNKRKA